MDCSKIPGAQYICFKKGEYLVKSGDKVKHFFLIVSGSCHRVKTTYKGDQIIMSTFIKDNIACSFMAYYDLTAASDIIAASTVYCWKIPRKAFIEEMEHNSKLMKALLEQIMQDYFDLSLRFRFKQEGHTPNFLCHLLASKAHKNSAGELIVDKVYTNVNIAAQLGVHKVTATRIINILQKEGIIERTKNGLLIKDLERLNEYAIMDKQLKY